MSVLECLLNGPRKCRTILQIWVSLVGGASIDDRANQILVMPDPDLLPPPPPLPPQNHQPPTENPLEEGDSWGQGPVSAGSQSEQPAPRPVPPTHTDIYAEFDDDDEDDDW